MEDKFDLLSALEKEHEDAAASGVETVSQNGLASIAHTARLIRLAQQDVEHAKESLKEKEAELRRLTDEVMPSLFSELGLTSFTLDDGSKLEVRQTYSATPLAENRPKVYEWLRENGYGDLIKNTVFCTFGREEDDKARQFFELAEEKGYVAEAKTEVHPSTLRAFVRERVESGDTFPMDLFGAWVGQRATIKKG